VSDIRTSLDRVAPSGFTSAELAAGAERFERELWARHRAIVVRLDRAPGLPRLVTMALEAWAKGRFG
jgi:hypothetical protein